MNYKEAKEYILEVPRFTTKHLPQETRAFYRSLGCPGQEKRIIHIAGTNGKGSVCAYLSSVYRREGYHVGMFTSPHLVSIRERFQIDGEKISRKEFADIFQEVYRQIQTNRGSHPTFFELLFFMAMLWFSRYDTDVILLETGLGGRLDATNCIERKDLCVLTEIGLDHMEYLGNSISQIAMEKAGIMRAGVPTVYTERQNEAAEVFRKRAKELGCLLISADFADAQNIRIGKNNIDFYLQSRYDGYVPFSIPFSALYQVENAITAIRSVEALQDKLPVLPENLVQGIGTMHWEGRMEEILPEVYLDGAHNEDGIRAFITTVKEQTCKGRNLLLFSAVSDKRSREMAQLLEQAGIFSVIYLTEIQGKRKTGLSDLLNEFENPNAQRDNGETLIRGCADTEQAFRALLKEKGPGDRAYIAGSLYLVGEIKRMLSEDALPG